MKTPTSSGESESNKEKSGASDIRSQSAGAADDLLKADHREVEGLFKQYKSADDAKEKEEIIRKVCVELSIHTQLEEEIFYPACRKKQVEHKDLDEAQVEHDTAKILIEELAHGDPGDPYRDAKVTVLCEYIRHHVGEEENPGDGIFAKAHQAGLDMGELGKKLQARKTELMARDQRFSRFLPAPLFRSLHHQREVQSQEGQTMPRYAQAPERDEHGRFMSDDSRRGGR
jgi:hemerythrin superfamily protein